MDSTQPGPFRLLDLAQEIQDWIYEKYFEAAKPAFFAGVPAVAISNSDGKDCNFAPLKINYIDPQLKVCGVPSLAIELISKKVCADARAARNRVISTTVEAGTLGDATTESVLMDIADRDEFGWLRRRTAKLLIKHQPSHGYPKDWSLIFDAFPNLHHVVLELYYFDNWPGFSPQGLVKAFKNGEFDDLIAEVAIKGPELVRLSELLKQKSPMDCSITCVTEPYFTGLADDEDGKELWMSMVSSPLRCRSTGTDGGRRRGLTGSLRTLLLTRKRNIATLGVI